MTVDMINKYAFADDLPDTELSCPERCLYFSLRDLYREFKAGLITKEQGEKKKRDAVSRFKRDCGELDAARKVVQSSSGMWQRIEMASLRYNRDRTLENADAFVEAVYNVKLKARAEENEKEEGDPS